MIRQILAEELAKVTAPAGGQVREEVVRIASDADLAAFTSRLLALSRDPQARREIEAGRWVFRLGDAPAPSMTAPPAAPLQRTARIERGFVGERQVDALAEGVTVLQVTKAVRFTPLARDRLRQRGIAIERSG